MPKYFATHITGASKLIQQFLQEDILDVNFEEKYNNFIVFSTEQDLETISLPYLNNYFHLINKFGSPDMQNFEALVSRTAQREKFVTKIVHLAKSRQAKTYKVYFFQDNKSVSESESLAAVKELISQNTTLKHTASRPDLEIWFVLRKEGTAVIGARITQKADYQATLPAGSLRPELAYIMARLAQPEKGEVILDPFSGNNTIPKAVLRYFPQANVVAGDIVGAKASKHCDKQKLRIEYLNGYHLSNVDTESIDKIVTDPPWGVSTNEKYLTANYTNMLYNFFRVLKNKGKLILLTGNNPLVMSKLTASKLKLQSSYDVIVGGQHANLSLLTKA